MTAVNTPTEIGLPQALVDLGFEVVTYFQQQNRYDLQMFTRSGGAADKVDNSAQTLTSTGSRVSLNAAKINALEKVASDIEIITADFTTSRNQIILCNNTSPINVTLDPDAIEEDVVNIKRNDAQVTVFGTIDGQVDMVLNVPKYSTKLVFNGTDWSRI